MQLLWTHSDSPSQLGFGHNRVMRKVTQENRKWLGSSVCLTTSSLLDLPSCSWLLLCFVSPSFGPRIPVPIFGCTLSPWAVALDRPGHDINHVHHILLKLSSQMHVIDGNGERKRKQRLKKEKKWSGWVTSYMEGCLDIPISSPYLLWI